jgi:hypothetical protein
MHTCCDREGHAIGRVPSISGSAARMTSLDVETRQPRTKKGDAMSETRTDSETERGAQGNYHTAVLQAPSR